MPISSVSDGDTSWGDEVRAVITAVNDLETSPRVKVSEAPLSLLDPRVAATLDGTGDQAAKIATAISLLPAAGGAIYQPPGILRTGAITLTKPVRWFGAGDQASTIKAAASFTGTLFTIADTAPFSRVSDVQFDGASTAVYLLKVASARTRLDHLHFTGQAGASGAALWFNGVSSNSSAHAAQVSDVRVIGCTGYAALLQGFAYDNEFSNFWAGTCNVGIRIENTNAFFTNTHIWGMTGNGVELRDGNHLFTNTYVETCGGSGFNLFNAHRVKIANSNLWKNQSHGVSLATSDRCSIIGCNIYDQGGMGVNATDSMYGQVIGNTFYDDTSSVQTQDRPINTSGTSDRWVVVGNVMRTSEHATGASVLSGSNNIIASNLTDTDSAGDLAETIDDRVAALIVAGAGVTKTYDDGAGTLTLTATGGGVDAEQVRDTMATALVAGDNVTITPNDGADTITIAASGGGSDDPPLVHAVGNSGTALTLDAASASGYIKTITLNGNCTFTLIGATAGQAATLELILTQDGTGGRTVTWPASVKWSGPAPTLSTAAAAVDRVLLSSYNGGTTWYADLVGKGYA